MDSCNPCRHYYAAHLAIFSMLDINDQRLFYAAHQRLFYAEHGLGASSIAQQLKIQEHGIYIVMRKSTTESTNI